MASTVSGNQASVTEMEKNLEALQEEGSKEEIEKAKEALKEAKERLALAQAGYENYKANPKEEPDFTAEDNAKKAWESEIKALEKAAEDAGYGREDALAGNADSLRDAGRRLEDAKTPGRADSTLEIYRMELDKLKKEIEKYRKIYKEDGKVASNMEGTVTKINLTVGERTADGAAIVCADKEVPYQFEALITKEQKKYVNQGDAVTLSTPEGKKELQIDYLEEDGSGVYRAVVYLPLGEGSLGMSGTFVKYGSSDSYECCVPIDALHREGTGGRCYVYLAVEREGILGTERYVEMRYVKVLDQNDDYAALEDGSVSKDEQIIIDSDKAVENNAVIRISGEYLQIAK